MAKCSNDPLNMITPNQALRTQHRHSCYYSAHWPTINQSLRLHRRRLRDWTWWNMAARLLFLDGKNAGVSESRVHLAVLHCDLIWTIMIHHQRSSLCLNKAQSGNSSTKKTPHATNSCWYHPKGSTQQQGSMVRLEFQEWEVSLSVVRMLHIYYIHILSFEQEYE